MNGWTNYATWLINLHFEDLLRDYIEEDQVQNYSYLRAYIQDYLTEVQTLPSGFLQDAMGSFLNDVNWKELYDHYIE